MAATASAQAYDVIVIGLGAHGSATLRALAARGVKVLGIDQYSPPHALGSSHGETRITRQAVGEGEAYAPLVLRSHELWRELEAETGLDLFRQCGGLVLAPIDGTAKHHGHDDFLSNTIAVAEQYKIEHEVLSSDDIGRRFPQFVLSGNEKAYYEPGAGFVRPELCIEAQLRVARAHGARILVDERVLSLEEDGSSVVVKTDKGTYCAASTVVTAGAWIPELVGGDFAKHLNVHRQTLHWYEVGNAAEYAPDRFPVFIWMWGREAKDYFYGFPVDGAGVSGLKVATEQYAETSNPDHLMRDVSDYENMNMYDTHVASRLKNVQSKCVKSAACLYTTSADSGFLIDAHPQHPRIMVVSACSGHGFKHSAGLGERICEYLTNANPASDILDNFRSRRYSHGT